MLHYQTIEGPFKVQWKMNWQNTFYARFEKQASR